MATLAETIEPLFAVQLGGPAVETAGDRSRRADKYAAQVFAAIAEGSEDAEVLRIAALAAPAVTYGLTHPEYLDAWRAECAAADVDAAVVTAVEAYMEAAGLMPFVEA